jgi:hypothetical protein
MEELKLQKLFNGFENNAEDWECEATVILNGFEGIGCLSTKSVDKSTIIRSVQPPSPLLCCVPATRQEKQLCLQNK